MDWMISQSRSRVGEGQVISLEYRVRLESGQVVEATSSPPIDSHTGGGQTLPALEGAPEGLGGGERAAFSIAAEDAYGARDVANVATLPRKLFPPEADLKPGAQL